jgi:hypothetical protein
MREVNMRLEGSRLRKEAATLQKSLAGAYDQWGYLPEMRKALEALSAEVARIVGATGNAEWRASRLFNDGKREWLLHRTTST